MAFPFVVLTHDQIIMRIAEKAAARDTQTCLTVLVCFHFYLDVTV